MLNRPKDKPISVLSPVQLQPVNFDECTANKASISVYVLMPLKS